jgi:hypothetical protein
MSETEGEWADVLHKSQETTPNLKKLPQMPASVFLNQWKKLFYKSQETAPNASQRVSKPQWKKLAKSRLPFLSASFYVPGTPCITSTQSPPPYRPYAPHSQAPPKMKQGNYGNLGTLISSFVLAGPVVFNECW